MYIQSADIALTSGDAALLGGVMAFIAAFAVIGVVFGIALYIYSALALMTIAKKTNTEPNWLAWIPIANFYLMLKIANMPWFWMFALLAPIIPVLGGLLFLGLMIYVWWKICEARKYPGWMSLLLLIPLVNLVIMGVIAWRDN